MCLLNRCRYFFVVFLFFAVKSARLITTKGGLCFPKAGIEMLVWYCCYKICFQRENLTRTSAGMLSTLLRSPSGTNVWQKSPSIHVSLISRNGKSVWLDLRLQSPRQASNKQVLSDIFGSCRRYSTINSSVKSDETVKTTSYKENITCEARSAVKSSPQISKSHGHFLLIQFGLKQPIPFYKIICKKRPVAKPYQKTLGPRKCTALPEIFMIRIFHCTRMEVTGQWK